MSHRQLSLPYPMAPACLATLLLLAGAGPTTAVSVRGTVSDPAAGPVEGARVELRAAADVGTATVSTTTDSSGTYRLADVEAGTYSFLVLAPGYEPFKTSARIPQSTQSTRLDAELVRLSLQAEITVTSSLPDFVSALELERSALEAEGQADLVQALRYQSGMSAVRRGPINLDPQIRGLQEGEVGVFVDGTRTFAAGPARMDSELSHVSQHAIRGVQVVKGPYALTWGAGSMSAIQLETYRPPFSSASTEIGGRVFGAYSDNNEVADGFANLWASGKRVRFNVSHNERSGNDFTAGNGAIVPADFESSDSRWSADVQLGERALLDYSGGYQGQDGIDYPGRILDATYFKTRSHNLELQWGGGEIVTGIFAQVYANHKDHLMNNDEKPTAFDMPGRVPPFGLRVELPAESNTTGARFSLDLDHGDWQNKAGTDYYRSEQTATRRIFRRSNDLLLFEDIVWPDAEAQDVGLYWQSVRRGDRLEIGGTVRLDLFDTKAGEVSDFFLQNTSGELDQEETNLSVALSLATHLRENWLLNAGIGRAVRSASTLERYSDRFPSTKFQVAAEFMGDPDIEPEKSHELNLGSRVRGRHDLLFVVDLFYRRIDDYITVEPGPSLPKRLPLSPPVVFRYRNGTEAMFWGGELRLSQTVGEHLDWRAGIDYVRGDDEHFDEPAFGMPPLQAELGLFLYSADRRFWADVRALLVDSQNRVAGARMERPTPGYTIFDLRAGAHLGHGLELSAGVENLTDEAYTHHLNSFDPFARVRIPEIGRNARLAVSYRF